MKKTLLALAVVLPASAALAAMVTWSDFEVGTNYGLGEVGENMTAPHGYGPPSSYALSTAEKTTGNSSQAYIVPPSAFFVDPDGEGWMRADDGGSTFAATDWDDFLVNVLGGPAPAGNSPLTFIADVRIDVDDPADYNVMKWLPVQNAPSSTFTEFDPINNALHDFGVWETDFEFLSTSFDGAGQAEFILLLDSQFEINNDSAGTATYYLDNVRIEYIPEPAILALLGLGAPALVRRRR